MRIPKILIVQSYNNEQKEIYDLTKKNWEQYAKKHNYGYIAFNQECENQHPTFVIENALIKVLTDKKYKTYDYIFWADIDSLVMNSNIKLESIIINYKTNIQIGILETKINQQIEIINNNINIIKSNNSRIYKWETLNTGHMFIKNNDWCLEFLKQVIKMDLSDEKYSYLNSILGDEVPFTLLYNYDENKKEHFAILDINNVFVCDKEYQLDNLNTSYNLRYYKRGDFIYHASGMPKNFKMLVLNKYLKFLKEVIEND